MSFVVRAALVIATLSWLALQRPGSATPDPSAAPRVLTDSALAAWQTLPVAVREAALHEGGAEIARRAGALATGSRDTLVDSDRTLPWRGAPIRPESKRAFERGERPAP